MTSLGPISSLPISSVLSGAAVSGAAAITTTWSLSGTGKNTKSGQATITTTWTLSGTGKNTKSGQATITDTWSLSGTAKNTKSGQAQITNTWLIDAAADKLPRLGAAAITNTWLLSGTTKNTKSGQAQITTTWLLSGTAKNTKSGQAQITDTWLLLAAPMFAQTGCWRLYFDSGTHRWLLDGNNGQVLYTTSLPFSCSSSNVFDVTLVNHCSEMPGGTEMPATSVTVWPIGQPQCPCLASSSSSSSSSASSSPVGGIQCPECANQVPIFLWLTVGPNSPPTCIDGMMIMLSAVDLPPGFWHGMIDLAPDHRITFDLTCNFEGIPTWRLAVGSDIGGDFSIQPTATSAECDPLMLFFEIASDLADPCLTFNWTATVTE